MEVKPRLDKPHQITRAYSLLSEMCEELSQSITSKAALLYPDLVDVLQYLNQDTLMRQYQEIHSGRLCPNHQRLRLIVVVHTSTLTHELTGWSL